MDEGGLRHDDRPAASDEALSFLVARNDLTRWIWRRSASPRAGDLALGEVLIKVNKFAFTANNLTYAKLGDEIGYWRFFPVDEPWGQIPVWGLGEVVASRLPALREGERVYGYMPMASHLVVTPARVHPASFVDGASHRADLPKVYNEYALIDRDPSYDESEADLRLVLPPLFSLSFFLSEHLIEAGLFGAEIVVVSSASSKVAIGLAFLIAAKKAPNVRVIGLTSPRHVAFVREAGCYDEVLTYDRMGAIPLQPAAFVDVAGDSAILATVHRHLGALIKHSSRVGATHWGDDAAEEDLPGAKPEWFFTPDHILKRRREWGADALRTRHRDAMRMLINDARRWLRIEHGAGPQAVERVYQATLDGAVPPNLANVLSLGAEAP